MTKQEYAQYQAAIAEFFEREGVNNLSTGPIECDECAVPLSCGECPQCGKDSGSIPQEPYFSSRRCECCRTPLAGDREDAHGWNPTVEQVQRYSVCSDCVYYAEYGQLDDDTMWDIEHSAD